MTLFLFQIIIAIQMYVLILTFITRIQHMKISIRFAHTTESIVFLFILNFLLSFVLLIHLCNLLFSERFEAKWTTTRQSMPVSKAWITKLMLTFKYYFLVVSVLFAAQSTILIAIITSIILCIRWKRIACYFNYLRIEERIRKLWCF
jgi:hypothetical protein